MMYNTMKKLIENANAKLANCTLTQEEYELVQADNQAKMDMFLAMNRLTLAQYEQLCNLAA